VTADARELLERALKLPERERALLVDVLSESIGGSALDPAFAAELVERARRVLEGGERGEPADEVMARLRSKHGL
jgi:hypothetical protein